MLDLVLLLSSVFTAKSRYRSMFRYMDERSDDSVSEYGLDSDLLGGFGLSSRRRKHCRDSSEFDHCLSGKDQFINASNGRLYMDECRQSSRAICENTPIFLIRRRSGAGYRGEDGQFLRRLITYFEYCRGKKSGSSTLIPYNLGNLVFRCDETIICDRKKDEGCERGSKKWHDNVICKAKRRCNYRLLGYFFNADALMSFYEACNGKWVFDYEFVNWFIEMFRHFICLLKKDKQGCEYFLSNKSIFVENYGSGNREKKSLLEVERGFQWGVYGPSAARDIFNYLIATEDGNVLADLMMDVMLDELREIMSECKNKKSDSHCSFTVGWDYLVTVEAILKKIQEKIRCNVRARECPKMEAVYGFRFVAVPVSRKSGSTNPPNGDAAYLLYPVSESNGNLVVPPNPFSGTEAIPVAGNAQRMMRDSDDQGGVLAATGDSN